MGHKPVVYSRHARRRLKQRHIMRSDVRWLLAKGVREQTAGNPQQWTARGFLGAREARVIYIETARQYFIRTVMWIGGDD